MHAHLAFVDVEGRPCVRLLPVSHLPDRPRTLGHRAARRTTLWRTRSQQCTNGVELDVRLTNDGVPVVLHDEDFVRVGGPARWAVEMSAADVAMVLLRGDATVPRLDDVLAWTGSQ